VLAGLLFCLVFGAIQGTLITRLHLPSFIVTLAGYLVANGLFLKILLFGPFSGYPNLIGQTDNLHFIYNLMWGTIDPVVSWIGANPEAARRAGINLSVVRTTAFMLCSFTAGIALLLYASYLNGMSNNVQAGYYVLYAVAAAVIGGTSLMGGRGKPLHGVLGGLVIGAIYNGMYLLALSFEWQYIVTGLVLLAAIIIDAVSRRGS